MAFLLFPVVINYLSPYIIIDGAAAGIVNGSFLVFIGLFVSSLFVGAGCGVAGCAQPLACKRSVFPPTPGRLVAAG